MTEARKELIIVIVAAVLVLAVILGVRALYQYLDDDRNFGSESRTEGTSRSPRLAMVSGAQTAGSPRSR